MAKARKSVKTVKKSSRRSVARSSTFHGLEHDFVLIAGGGFVLLLLVMIVLYY